MLFTSCCDVVSEQGQSHSPGEWVACRKAVLVVQSLWAPPHLLELLRAKTCAQQVGRGFSDF